MPCADLATRPPVAGQARWQAHEVRCGLASTVDVAERVIERIRFREADVLAWAWCEAEEVRQRARTLLCQEAATLGALAGVPIGIKDVFDTFDMPTACGSRIHEGKRPKRDAAAVKRLREAGALIVGKTATAEFAYASPAATRNPHDPARTPGGSSSGSAAAVAAGMVPIALGTQTGGSIIRPAAFCGVFGFKPTFAAIDCEGVRPLAPSLDTVGILAASIDDIVLAWSVLRGAAADGRAGRVAPPRIGIYPGPHAGAASPSAQSTLASAEQRLRDAGANVSTPDLPHGNVHRWGELNRDIMAFEAALSLRTEFEAHRGHLSVPLLELLRRGLSIDRRTYEAALKEVSEGRALFAEAAASFDALVTYSTDDVAPMFGEGTGSSLYCRAWTTLGVPALHVPILHRPIALPLGIQLVAAAGSDDRLLQTAQWVAHVLNDPCAAEERC